MKANQLLANHLRSIWNQQSVQISPELFSQNDPNYQYRCLINEHLPNQIGVYLWADSEGNIIYIGKAGTLKTNGNYTTHTVRQRNLAPRCRVDGRDVLTADYIRQILEQGEIDSVTITALTFDTTRIVPAFFEAQLLQEFYSVEGILPRYNKSF
jgi:hypothetical protein